MKKAYFFQGILPTGEGVDIVYESEYRRGTFFHKVDLVNAIVNNKIELKRSINDPVYEDLTLFTHILNKKNMDEQMFGEGSVIDCR